MTEIYKRADIFVFWDNDGVLVEESEHSREYKEQLIKKLKIKDADKQERFLQLFNESYKYFCVGETVPLDLANAFLAVTDGQIDLRLKPKRRSPLVKAYRKVALKPNREVLAVAKALNKLEKREGIRVRQGISSNTFSFMGPQEEYKKHRRVFNKVTRVRENVLLSHLVKRRKPHKDMYDLMIDRADAYQIPPERIIFVDNRKVNDPGQHPEPKYKQIEFILYDEKVATREKLAAEIEKRMEKAGIRLTRPLLKPRRFFSRKR